MLEKRVATKKLRRSSRHASSSVPSIEERHSPLDPSRVRLDLRLWTVYKHLVSDQDTVEVFMDLPSRELYPSYYEFTTSPICLAEVQEKVSQQQYRSVRLRFAACAWRCCVLT